MGGRSDRRIPPDPPAPAVVLIGELHRTRSVRQALSSLELEPTEVASFREALQRHAWQATAAWVLVPPLRGILVDHALGILKASPRGADAHAFVVVHADMSDACVARLYDRGATAVFTLPAEASTLAPRLRAALAAEPPRPGRADAHQRLARSVRASLRAAGSLPDSVRIALRDGRARLSGSVDRLWRKRSLEQRVAQVPGVRAVASHELEVQPAGVPDAEIARRVRRLLEGASSIGDQTLAASVQTGHVTLAGTVLNQEEWLHAFDLISRVEGVRSVANRTRESARKQRDRSLAHTPRSDP